MNSNRPEIKRCDASVQSRAGILINNEAAVGDQARGPRSGYGNGRACVLVTVKNEGGSHDHREISPQIGCRDGPPAAVSGMKKGASFSVNSS